MIITRLERWVRQFGRTGETAVTAAPPEPPCHRGEITELSVHHIAGWLHDPSRPGHRIAYEIALDGVVLARGMADRFQHGLHFAGIGDGAHGLHARLPAGLDDAARARIVVRPAGGGAYLPRAAPPRPTFEPLLHVAMDIVDNCNLRCPFCLYDYANTHATHCMDDTTFAASLRLLPYVRDGEFWLSCLHEATLHPRLVEFIGQVPAEYRRKLSYTTNLAKRMPAAYYACLADSGIHHMNISIESRDPALYERMRKGARHRIFVESWDALLAAFANGSAPPRLNYVVMAYKSNLAELPDLVAYLLEHRRAATVQLRYTFAVPHLAPEFCDREFLSAEEWCSLRDRLAGFPGDRVQLMMPPAVAAAAAEGAALADYYMLRMSYDGTLRVIGIRAGSRADTAIETELCRANINQIFEPMDFFNKLYKENEEAVLF